VNTEGNERENQLEYERAYKHWFVFISKQSASETIKRTVGPGEQSINSYEILLLKLTEAKKYLCSKKDKLLGCCAVKREKPADSITRW
jgi:hypothetical protein